MAQVVEERRTRTSDDPAVATASQTWRGQPLVAGVLRTSLFLVPPGLAFLVTCSLYRVIDTPASSVGRWALWLALLVVGFVVVLVCERFARRFLPVAMLMRLTVVFPDQAPSRYKVLRQAASPAKLKEIAASDGDSAGAAVQVLALVAQLARHDKHTRGHSERVRVFSDLIADELGIVGLDRDKLRWSALLHDIGKMDVPAEILNKNGRPTREEWAVLQAHPAAGRGRAGALAEWLGPWAGGIAEHHERWDGGGYPARLAGNDITLAGRIVAVADAYETMTAARSYKKPMATRAARQELADCAGSQFDPRVVRAFLAVSLPKLLWKTGPLSFLVHLPFLGQLQSAGSQLATGSAQMAGTTVLAGLTATAVVTGVVPASFASSPTAVGQPAVDAVGHGDAATLAVPARLAFKDETHAPAGGRTSSGGAGGASAKASPAARSAGQAADSTLPGPTSAGAPVQETPPTSVPQVAPAAIAEAPTLTAVTRAPATRPAPVSPTSGAAKASTKKAPKTVEGPKAKAPKQTKAPKAGEGAQDSEGAQAGQGAQEASGIEGL